MKLHDAYLSVHEALKHAGVHHGCRVRVRWVDAEHMSYEEAVETLDGVDGVLVPGGFGSRGWEGKILACRVAREHGIPYLGICLGMHVAVSEFARHVAGLEGANSTEMDPETPYPVIDLLPEQKEIEDLGGTMRLGAQAVELAEGTRAQEAYGEGVVHERHRHRYEVNNHYRPGLAEAGLVVSGTYQEGRLVEIIELPDHPVVRGQPVPPGVQEPPDPARAALPRLRRRRARARAVARRQRRFSRRRLSRLAPRRAARSSGSRRTRAPRASRARGRAPRACPAAFRRRRGRARRPRAVCRARRPERSPSREACRASRESTDHIAAVMPSARASWAIRRRSLPQGGRTSRAAGRRAPRSPRSRARCRPVARRA